jgi:uncharacterized protein YndB with AHSA1/START domain
VTPNRHGSAVIEFPNELEIVTTREFDAPIELVFDVLTKPEHVSKWFAPFACEVTECSIDLRVGGNYHIVFVTEDGTDCSFRGTYLEVEPPTRTVETWLFEGWPDADAVEFVDLHETDGVTKLTMKLAFRDKAGRDHMTKSDGQEDSFNKMEDYLRSLLDQRKTVSGSRGSSQNSKAWFTNVPAASGQTCPRRCRRERPGARRPIACFQTVAVTCFPS